MMMCVSLTQIIAICCRFSRKMFAFHTKISRSSGLGAWSERLDRCHERLRRNWGILISRVTITECHKSQMNVVISQYFTHPYTEEIDNLFERILKISRVLSQSLGRVNCYHVVYQELCCIPLSSGIYLHAPVQFPRLRLKSLLRMLNPSCNRTGFVP